MFRSVLEVLFPPACLACGGSGSPFCAACWTRVAVATPPGCIRCGRPMEVTVASCRDCPPSEVAWARAAFLYEGAVRQALIRLKFGGMRWAAGALAPWLGEALQRAPPRTVRPDISVIPTVSWVPLGRSRKRRRGFDQAEALARPLGAAFGWPVQSLLARQGDTAPQARRTGPERRMALQGAFRATGPAPSVVVLVDDVLTTGATAAACALALRDAGAREVGLLVAARSLGGPVPARCYTSKGLRPGSVVARERFSR